MRPATEGDDAGAENGPRLRIGVRGALGRMGQEACRSVEASDDLELVLRLDLGDDAATALRDEPCDVVLDLTRPDALDEGIPTLLEGGAAVVIGTSGVGEARIEAWRPLVERHGGPLLVVPNFCVGVVLLQRFAQEAARFYRDVELIELHHEKKVDSPSGTAADTARRIAHARPEGFANANEDDGPFRGERIEGIPTHSVRLPGLLAHQEVLFGAEGEVLRLRHDSTSRSSFMPGVLLALRRVRDLSGVVVGLENCLDGAGAS